MRPLFALASTLALVTSLVACSSGDGGGSSDDANGDDARVDDSMVATHDTASTDARDAIADAPTDSRAGDTAIDAPTDATADAKIDVVTGDLVMMPFGDSITGEPHTYRETLYASLTSAKCAVHFVGSQTDVYATIPEKNHEGHPGFTIENMATNADAWLAAAPPKIVLMMIGTNDIAWWYAGTAAEVGDAHAKLMDQILADAPGVWLIVASIPPESSAIVEPNKYDRSDFTKLVNAEIVKHVDERIAAGKKVRFADVNAALAVSDLRDGIHPTPEGYAKVAGVWFDALKPIAACLGATP